MFEKTALQHADVAGIKGAYFAEGTMFCDADSTPRWAVERFVEVYPDTIVTILRNGEIAVDFTI